MSVPPKQLPYRIEMLPYREASLLIYILFKRTNFKLWAKFLFIPICFIAPFSSTALWPFLIKYSGFIGATGGDGTISYQFIASKLFGEYSDFVWAGITTVLVLLIFKWSARGKLI
jgi:hypothetical protein